MKRRKWLWIGGGLLAVVALYAAFSAAVRLDPVERAVNDAAESFGLVMIEPRPLLTFQSHEVRPIRYTFESSKLDERLYHELVALVERKTVSYTGLSLGAVSLSNLGRTGSWFRQNGDTTEASNQFTVATDGGHIEVDVNFSRVDRNSALTILRVSSFRKSLWERLKDMFSPSPRPSYPPGHP